jgi:hypothetical protein
MALQDIDNEYYIELLADFPENTYSSRWQAHILTCAATHATLLGENM